ncbi:hypothetical protein V2J09_020842 [Rumex salicifolius]
MIDFHYPTFYSSDYIASLTNVRVVKEPSTHAEAFLIKLGFHQSKFDHSVFLWDSPKGFIVVIVYVDDLLVTSVSSELIRFIKDELHMAITIKGLGLCPEQLEGILREVLFLVLNLETFNFWNKVSRDARRS